jgi:hypothetical protein
MSGGLGEVRLILDLEGLALLQLGEDQVQELLDALAAVAAGDRLVRLH